MKHLIFCFFIILFFLGCITHKNVFEKSNLTTINNYKVKKNAFTEIEAQNWYVKDILIDTIPGISLEGINNKILKSLNSYKTVVAVIDTHVDFKHPKFKNVFWVNENEIPNNKIDDDNNGYVDDVNGWNFISNSLGESIRYSNLESIRIIRKYGDDFEKKDSMDISESKMPTYLMYLQAKNSYESKLKSGLDTKEYGDFLYNTYPESKASLKKIFPNEDYTIAQLDSLYDLHKDSDKELAGLIYYMADFKKYNLTKKWVDDYKERADKRLETTLNIEFQERNLIGDNPNDLDDKIYGSNQIDGTSNGFAHSTKVIGVISDEKNSNGKIQIMPLCISSLGDEHDKDIALAIYYAVNNGAKIINLSLGKDFSLYKKWVFESFKYAEKHNVLIVSSAGNSNYNLNEINNYYPNDNFNNEKEVSDNFLLVGASTSIANENLFAGYSNYGNIDVDIFAPGDKIYTTIPNAKYDYDSGTSLAAALTSKVAALIFSHYPNLTASQVKHIIMDSGVEYTFPVKTPTREDKDKMTPFNELSKSGKIVNAYNALIMADSISKKKN